MTHAKKEPTEKVDTLWENAHRCNALGPEKYRCTEDLNHEGFRHVARAVIGASLGSEIVRWVVGSIPEWNPEYRGR
jgi:hypothetical protein